LWEEVLQRDSLLDILARFVHLQVDEKRDGQGRKVKAESMIFPATISSRPSGYWWRPHGVKEWGRARWIIKR